MKALISFVVVWLTATASIARAHAGTDPDVAAAIVNINTASERELVELPGIGPAKAAAIVAYREKHGGFRRVEDLRKVRGFGRKSVARLRPALTVHATAGPPSTTADLRQ